jgi:hypothetical protein
MKKFLFIISIIFVMVSCNPIPNKSITEPLTKKEFVKIQEKTDVETANMLSTLSILPFTKKYQDITYRDIFEYRKMSLDSSYWKTYKVEWEKEYNEIYKNSLHKFDSIITLCEYYYVNFDSLYFDEYNRKFVEGYFTKDEMYYMLIPSSLNYEVRDVEYYVYNYISGKQYRDELYNEVLKTSIIQEQIDENYMNIVDFLDKKKREILSNKFPMVHQFAVEISEL